jgi:hypothetical protein
MISGVRLFCTLIAGALIAGAGTACAAGPADGGAAWGLPQLMQDMAEVKSERRRFTEKKYLKVLTAPLESSGVLVYRAPGHLEKLTLQPRKESMVLDQGIIEIVEPSRHVRRTLMANQYPAVAALVESMRATLAGDASALTRYYRTTVQGAAAHWHLQLVPLDAAAREVVREIRIEGRAHNITGIEIVGVDGDRTVMAVGAALPAAGPDE